MRIERVQKGSAGNAIGSASPKPSGIYGARITTDDVISTTSRVIGIVDTELCVVKNIKGLCAELNVSGLPNLEVFQQRHVKIQPAWIVQKIAPRVPKGESARSHKLRRITDERPKTLRVAAWRLRSSRKVGI